MKEIKEVLEMSNKRLILAVAVDDENNDYTIDIPAGSNVAETSFAMAVVVRCFVKDGLVNDPNVVVDMIRKYATEVQYDPI